VPLLSRRPSLCNCGHFRAEATIKAGGDGRSQVHEGVNVAAGDVGGEAPCRGSTAVSPAMCAGPRSPDTAYRRRPARCSAAGSRYRFAILRRPPRGMVGRRRLESSCPVGSRRPHSSCPHGRNNREAAAHHSQEAVADNIGAGADNSTCALPVPALPRAAAPTIPSSRTALVSARIAMAPVVFVPKHNTRPSRRHFAAPGIVLLPIREASPEFRRVTAGPAAAAKSTGCVSPRDRAGCSNGRPTRAGWSPGLSAPKVRQAHAGRRSS
jgi:hypothetical protein